MCGVHRVARIAHDTYSKHFCPAELLLQLHELNPGSSERCFIPSTLPHECFHSSGSAKPNCWSLVAPAVAFRVCTQRAVAFLVSVRISLEPQAKHLNHSVLSLRTRDGMHRSNVRPIRYAEHPCPNCVYVHSDPIRSRRAFMGQP